MFLSHESMARDNAVEMMMQYLGSSPEDALDEVNETRGAHAQFSYLRRIFKGRLLQHLEADNEGGMKEEVQKLWDQTLRIYLMYLVGITLFTDKSTTYVDVVYLRYFRELEVVVGYSSGAAALSHLYRELNHVAHWNCKHLLGYLTLLLAWVYKHFSVYKQQGCVGWISG
ncbi:protein MAIN-LIKE 1-like [Medicago truncatula]|uniref:protein MAIN-LIKE 1-like n=1 Tax=Medicago truncatula TaxID=3880 RepID=UPI001967F804|nr:protein MAIN-LIKE 1-like [Medicago truncatula]